MREGVARGHKLAVRAHRGRRPVIKLGFPIGRATQEIAPGAHVHSHNLATALAGGGWISASHRGPADTAGSCCGGRRELRRAIAAPMAASARATRSGCSRRSAASRAPRRRSPSAPMPRHAGRVDGVHAFAHPFGCSQLGDDLAGTRDVLAALASHPNAGGVLIVGLGCESNQLDALLAEIDPGRQSIRTLRRAGCRGRDRGRRWRWSTELVESAATGAARAGAAVRAGAGREMRRVGRPVRPHRQPAGRADERRGDRRPAARAILTEIPEIFGAEQLLMARAADEGVFGAIVALVNGFKRYFTRSWRAGVGKSLARQYRRRHHHAGGKVARRGAEGRRMRSSPTCCLMAGASAAPASTLLEAPGNDAVSSTALAAAGATAILFTTGRGTPLGFPVPTIKIASNSDLAARKPGWIDFDARPGARRRPGAGRRCAAAQIVCAIASGTRDRGRTQWRARDRDLEARRHPVTPACH